MNYDGIFSGLAKSIKDKLAKRKEIKCLEYLNEVRAQEIRDMLFYLDRAKPEPDLANIKPTDRLLIWQINWIDPWVWYRVDDEHDNRWSSNDYYDSITKDYDHRNRYEVYAVYFKEGVPYRVKGGTASTYQREVLEKIKDWISSQNQKSKSILDYVRGYVQQVAYVDREFTRTHTTSYVGDGTPIAEKTLLEDIERLSKIPAFSNTAEPLVLYKMEGE